MRITERQRSSREHFDEIRIEFFRDTTVALEAFKADQMDWRTEPSAKNWASSEGRSGFPEWRREHRWLCDERFR